MSFKLQNTLCPYTFQKIQNKSKEHVLPKWLRCEEFEDNQWIINAEHAQNNWFGGVVEGKLEQSDYAQNLGIMKEDGNKINIITGEVIENKRFFPQKDGVKIVSKYKGSLSKRDIGILNQYKSKSDLEKILNEHFQKAEAIEPTSKEISTEIDISLYFLQYLKIAVCYLIYKHGDEAFNNYKKMFGDWYYTFFPYYFEPDEGRSCVKHSILQTFGQRPNIVFPLYMPEIHGNMWRLNMIKLGNKQHPEFERAKNDITQRAGEIVKNYIPNEKMKNLVTAKPNVNHFLEDGGALWIYLAKMPVGLKLFLWPLN